MDRLLVLWQVLLKTALSEASYTASLIPPLLCARVRCESAEFRQVVAGLERGEACQGLTMQSFLTLPMQRVTRLPLLVDAVCHRMHPSHAAYPTVKACLYALQKVRTNVLLTKVHWVLVVSRTMESKVTLCVPDTPQKVSCM